MKHPALILAVLAATLPARAQPVYDAGRAAWEGGDYPTAIEVLLGYRRTLSERRVEVDYMLGTAGCRVLDERAWGGEVLDWMLVAYRLDPTSRRIVSLERDLCRAAQAKELETSRLELIAEERTAGMSGYGAFGGLELGSKPLRLEKPEIGEREAALFPADDDSKGEAQR